MSAAGAAPGEEKILVIKLGALGDFILAMGPFTAIRRHHPGARLILLTTAPFAPLGAACGLFDEVWLDDRPSLSRPGEWLALRRRLRGAGFSRVYDLQTSDRSGWYYRLMGPGRRPLWSGIVGGAAFRHDNPRRTAMHTIDRQAEQLRVAGIDYTPPADLSGFFDWANADLGRFDLPPAYALLVPGGAAHRPEKRWPAVRFGALSAEVAKKAGVVPVILGSSGETPLAQAIQDACPGAIDLTGRTSLVDIAALAREAVWALGNDTGPMHLAAAVGCPAVVLFSAASNPDLCAPRGRQVRVLRRLSLDQLPVAAVAEALPPAEGG